MSRKTGIGLTVALLVAFVVVMIPFTGPIPRAIGVILLFSFLVVGLFTVASPAFLRGGADRDG